MQHFLTMRVLVRAAGVALMFLAATADLFGIGEPGFGERQIGALAIGALLVAGSLLVPQRRANSPDRQSLGTPVSRVAHFYGDLAVVLLNTTLLVIVANLAAAVLLRIGTQPREGVGIEAPVLHIPLARAIHELSIRLNPRPHPALKLTGAELDELYPGWSRKQVEDLIAETLERPLQFDPYTQFREAPFRGRYVNVATVGFREGRDRTPWPMQADKFNVWVFGGSTTFGYGLADADTIPAQLKEALARRGGNSAVAVYNFGQAYFYSAQEAILLQTLLSANPPPAAAIFIDGINEHQRSPFYSEFLRELLRFSPRGLISAPQGDSFDTGPPVVDRWLRVARTEQAMCQAFGIRPLFVWQPAPNWHYDLSYHRFWHQSDIEGPAPPDVSPHYSEMAKLVSKEPNELGPNFLWLGDIQQGIKKPLYVDRLHYTASFAGVVATKIADRLGPMHH